MRDEQAAQETVIKERVKRDYDDLVHSLFTTSFALKNRFEEYRMSLYDDVVQGLCDVRKVGDATQGSSCTHHLWQSALERIKIISKGRSALAKAKLEAGITRAENLRDVQSENSNLTSLVLKVVCIFEEIGALTRVDADYERLEADGFAFVLREEDLSGEVRGKLIEKSGVGVENAG